MGTYTLPETSFAEVMFTVQEKSNLVGQKAKIAIDQGVPITTGMVVAPGTGLDAGGPPWANIIAAGKNAITIPISRLAAVGYGIADGAHVNVIACMLVVDVDPSYQGILPNHVSCGSGSCECSAGCDAWHLSRGENTRPRIHLIKVVRK